MNVEQDFRYVSYKGLKQFDNYKIDNTIIKDGKTVRSYLFKPGNKLSEFLACTRQVALIIGSNIFIHAGILPIIAKKYSVKSINQIMTLYLLDRIKIVMKIIIIYLMQIIIRHYGIEYMEI